MNVVIFYFSGTGNTLYVCEELERKLKEVGDDVRLLSIENLTDGDTRDFIAQSDTVILSYPVYGSDLPINMRRFITGMPAGGGKKLGVVATQYLFSGDGGCIMKSALGTKGYRQLWSYQINMPNNLCIPGSPFRQSEDYDFHEESKLRKARVKIAVIAQDVHAGRKRIEDGSPFHWLLAMTQRPFYRGGVRLLYSNALGIDPIKCRRCGKCVASCPTGVIEYQDKTPVHAHPELCLTCLRCLNFCPYGAVTFKGKVKEPLYKGPTKDIYTRIFHT